MSTDTKRNFLGVWIPAAIWLDRSLSITEKVMLVEINSLQDAERGCYASNEHIAEFFGLSKSRVSEIISTLADKNLVQVDLIREGKQIVERQIWMTETGRLLVGGVGPSSENTHTPLRKTRRPSSENKATLFGKDSDPSSEKAIGSNTDSNNTSSNTLNNTESLALESAIAPVKSVATKKSPAPGDEVWEAYSGAYFNRYGTNPVRNGKANKNILQFIDRVGATEAPQVAAFFLSHNKRYYLERTHDIGVMLADAEGLRTQWATGQTMTATKATQLDRTASNYDAAKQAIEMMKARNNHAPV